jgi:hypothetical protein
VRERDREEQTEGRDREEKEGKIQRGRDREEET